MTFADYLPLALPVMAIIAIVFAMRPRKSAKSSAPSGKPPESFKGLPGSDIEGLEAMTQNGAPDDLNRLHQILGDVASRGSAADLERLSRIDPASISDLGNTPAHLFRAIGRAEEPVKSALTAQRDAVLKIAAAASLLTWKELVEAGPGAVLDEQETFVGLVDLGGSGVVAQMLKDMNARERDAGWRAARLHLMGHIDPFHEDYPDGALAQQWLVDGLASKDRQERLAAIEAFPEIVGQHRFDMPSDDAAALRDRAIELAAVPTHEGADAESSIAEGLAQLVEDEDVDGAPIRAALAAVIDAMRGQPDVWEAAEDGFRRGRTLVTRLEFAQAAIETADGDAAILASALLAFERLARPARSLGKPRLDLELILHELAQAAPEPVVERLLDGALSVPEVLPDWLKRPANADALERAAARTDLSSDVQTRLADLATTTRNGVLKAWQGSVVEIFDRFDAMETPNAAAAAEQLRGKAELIPDPDAVSSAILDQLAKRQEVPFWAEVAEALSDLFPSSVQ